MKLRFNIKYLIFIVGMLALGGCLGAGDSGTRTTTSSLTPDADDARNITLAVSETTVVVANTIVIITAIVTDEDDIIIPDVEVSFLATAGVLSAETAITDGTGKATLNLTVDDLSVSRITVTTVIGSLTEMSRRPKFCRPTTIYSAVLLFGFSMVNRTR